ncbi:MAG TPA: alcohol dehydrogenase catalytic domain-containing protein [Baekduia sp.]|jgi:2-desacetyl-2-hydroxyethyl bacteriochlorophyllide A dehydrogenase
MRAARWQALRTVVVEDIDDPVAAEGDVLLEVEHCGICGSDLHSYEHGFVVKPGQVLGHEVSGRVVAAPGVAGIAVGDLATLRPLIPCMQCPSCLRGDVQVCEAGMSGNIGYGLHGGFAQRVLIPKAVAGFNVFPLPDGVGPRAAALVEPLAVSLHAVRIADPAPGDVAVVFGGGTIGLGTVRFLALAGVEQIVLVEPSAHRRAAGKVQGATTLVDPMADDVVAAIQAITGPGAAGHGARADVVIDCAGVQASIGGALEILRPLGTLVLCAIFGKRVEIRPDYIVGKELRVRGSLGYRDEFPDAIAALVAGDVDPESLISHEFGLEDIEDAFQASLDREASLKVLVTPPR